MKTQKISSGLNFQVKIGPRRPGDLANVVADSSLSRDELGWTCSKNLSQMCQDLWRWQEGDAFLRLINPAKNKLITIPDELIICSFLRLIFEKISLIERL